MFVLLLNNLNYMFIPSPISFTV